MNPLSNIYDQQQIQKRILVLSDLKKSTDFSYIGSNVRSGMIRNFCGIADERLFHKYYLGTKGSIDSYLEQVSSVLSYISQTNFDGSIGLKEKFELLYDSRQSLGQTALFLQGGSTFGLVHLGVSKSLFEQQLLPRVIVGNSVGALIASLICVHTDSELPVSKRL